MIEHTVIRRLRHCGDSGIVMNLEHINELVNHVQVCVYSNNQLKYTVMADVQNWQASRSLGPRGVELKKSWDWLACQIKESQHF